MPAGIRKRGTDERQGNRLTDILVPLPPGEVNLGLTLQWTPTNITENVWHILEIMDDSPAADAGLIAGDDYIVGTPEGIVRGDSALGELIEDVRYLRGSGQCSKLILSVLRETATTLRLQRSTQYYSRAYHNT